VPGHHAVLADDAVAGLRPDEADLHGATSF
jgi:hypothetical protein